MQKLFEIGSIGSHGKLTVCRTDKGDLVFEHAGTKFTASGLISETAHYPMEEQDFIKGIIGLAKHHHNTIPPEFRKCPFCGGTPKLEPNGDQFIVECDCGCVMGSFDSKWDAVASWNIRKKG